MIDKDNSITAKVGIDVIFFRLCGSVKNKIIIANFVLCLNNIYDSLYFLIIIDIPARFFISILDSNQLMLNLVWCLLRLYWYDGISDDFGVQNKTLGNFLQIKKLFKIIRNPLRFQADVLPVVFRYFIVKYYFFLFTYVYENYDREG